MREVKLPSGAVLKVQAAPFAEAKALYQALLRELKAIPITTATEQLALYKDFFCAGFSSPEIEAFTWECFKRCTYNTGAGDLKIDKDTFEPEERRADYLNVCSEVVKENVGPFLKSLSADFKQVTALLRSFQA